MVALYIILGIIALFLIILSIPLSVYGYYDEEFILYVKYTFFKFYIYPPQDRPKKEKKEKEKPEKKKEKKPDDNKKGDNFIVTFYKNQGVSGIIDLIGNVMAILKKSGKSIFRAFHIKHLYIKILVSSSDAAQTAVDYGKMCAKVYPSIGFITSNIKSKNVRVNVSPDFLGNKNKGSFSTKVNIIPRTLLGAIIVLGVKMVIQLIKIMISNSKAAAEKSKSKQAAAKRISNNSVQMKSVTKNSNKSSVKSDLTEKQELN